jgi:hypothetical protein
MLKKYLVGFVFFVVISVARAEVCPQIFVNNNLDQSVYAHTLTPNIWGTDKIHPQCVGIVNYTIDPLCPIAIKYRTVSGRGCLLVVSPTGTITLSVIGTATCTLNGNVLEMTLPAGSTPSISRSSI